MNYFELAALICFSSGWPFSIWKSWSSRSNEGKSFLYMVVILLGYVCGVLYKLTSTVDPVIWLYAGNTALVLVDMGLYYRNYRIAEQKAWYGR